MNLGGRTHSAGESPQRGAMKHALTHALKALGIVCLVMLEEKAIIRTGFFNVHQAVLWPTNGIALALLLRTERRQWWTIMPSVLLGSLIGVVLWRLPARVILANFVANAVGPLIAAAMLPRFRSLVAWMQEPGLYARFVTFAAVLAPLLSGLILAICTNEMQPGFWLLVQRRGVADMLGYALITPLTLIVSSRESYRWMGWGVLAETVALVSFACAATLIVFEQSVAPLSFLLLSIAVLIALRLGFRASVVAINLISFIAIVETMHGHGSFTLGAGSVLSIRILLLQLFLVLSMLTVFAVSVIQIEREVFEGKLKRAYEEMEELATLDALTGVSNRRQLESVMKMEWERAGRVGAPLALLMIDADHFKSYNDSFGHPAGDECLRSLVKAILKEERRSMDLLARYGGEEFVLLLPSCDGASAALVAERVRASIEGLYGSAGCSLRRRVTVSIGCAAMVPDADSAPQRLLVAADEALYRAKREGRNRVRVENGVAERMKVEEPTLV